MKRALITGVTGFLGKVVLEEILRRRDELGLEEVVVVIRSKGGRDAVERFRKEVAEAKILSICREKRWFVSKGELRRKQRKRALRKVRRKQKEIEGRI